MSSLTELREKVEKLDATATYEHRAVDAEIYNALVDDGGRIAFKVQNWAQPPGVNLRRWHDGWLVGKSPDDRYSDDLPRYTASIDAALALVERKFPGWKFGVTTERHASFAAYAAHAAIMDRDWPDPMAGYGKWFDGHAATPCLAILSALLRALESQEQAGG